MTDPSHFLWPKGQHCAVTLTYDDALPVHYENTAPLLASKGLCATFNLCARFGMTDHTDNWKTVADLGHELGNHTLFHACRREPVERYHWLEPHYDLCDYTVQRWMDEMRIANCLLRMIDGRKERTFGNTCCNTTIGRGDHEVSLDDLIRRLFVAGRGERNSRIVQPSNLNYAALGHFNGDGRKFSDLQNEIEQAAGEGGWIIFMFHGVGKGTHDGFIETDQHAALVDFLADNADNIWTTSMVDAATYLKQAGYAAVT